jgi:hypothetical protein
VFIYKGGLAKFHPDTKLTESFLRVMLLDDVDHGLNPLGHLFKIYRWEIHLWKAKVFGILYQVVNICCPDEGFAWNTSEMEAISPKLFAIFQSFCYWAAPMRSLTLGVENKIVICHHFWRVV